MHLRCCIKHTLIYIEQRIEGDLNLNLGQKIVIVLATALILWSFLYPTEYWQGKDWDDRPVYWTAHNYIFRVPPNLHVNYTHMLIQMGVIIFVAGCIVAVMQVRKI